MNYIETLRDPKGEKTHYKVVKEQVTVAEFSYHVANVAGRWENTRQFWLDEVKLADSYRAFEIMEPILLFVQYKCFSKNIGEIYLRISAKNLFYLELYRRFGFLVIDEKTNKDKYGKTSYDYILKYMVPMKRDDHFLQYLKRKDWR